MCCTEREDGAKTKVIFEAIDVKFSADGMPYENCIELSVDNASTMIGVNNSVASRFKNKNQNIFIGGYPCHLGYIADIHSVMYLDLTLKIFALISFTGIRQKFQEEGKIARVL